MRDFGLYQALRGTDNWAQKRQDKMQSLMIARERDQNSQKELKQSMELEQGMQKYFDEMKNLDALSEDQGRINDEEKKARRKIYKGIAAANGNLKAYMSSGGISAMSDYRNSVLNSEAAKNAATNKANYANWMKDASDGKFINEVNVEVPIMKDGEPALDDNGKPKTQIKSVSMKQQAALFQKGIIKRMNYGGAEEAVKINMFDFADQAKDPNNPYYAENVTTSDIITLARSRGASLAQARSIAKDYAMNTASSGQAWKWGKEDYDEALLKQAKAAKLRGLGRGKEGSSKTMITNQLAPALLNRLPEGGKTQFGLKDDKMWSDVYGLRSDSKTNMTKPTRPLVITDRDTDAVYDASNVLDIKFTGEYIKKNGEVYAVTDVVYDADEPRNKNPHVEDFFGKNNLTDDDTRHNWQFVDAGDVWNENQLDAAEIDSGKDVVRGQGLVALGSKLRDPVFKDSMNKFRGITTAQHGISPSTTNQDYYDQAGGGFEQAIATTMEDNPGMTEQDAVNYYYEYIKP